MDNYEDIIRIEYKTIKLFANFYYIYRDKREINGINFTLVIKEC